MSDPTGDWPPWRESHSGKGPGVCLSSLFTSELHVSTFQEPVCLRAVCPFRGGLMSGVVWMRAQVHRGSAFSLSRCKLVSSDRWTIAAISCFLKTDLGVTGDEDLPALQGLPAQPGLCSMVGVHCNSPLSPDSPRILFNPAV